MDYLIIIWIFFISIGINLIFFIIAFILKSDIFTDLTYTLTFIILSITIVTWKKQWSLTQILLFTAINIWALRLGSYLFIRIIKTKVDHRFDKMRNSFVKFGSFWLLQGISVAIISLPTIFALSINKNHFSQNHYYNFIPFILFLCFFFFEIISDYQKNKFYQLDNHPPFLQTGLWKISRHPNYFGEIMIWWSICIIFLSNYITDSYTIFWNLLWLLSPLYITLLIIFVSGIPILEKNSYFKLKNNLQYQEYLAKTSILIPWIGKKGLPKKLRNSN